MPRAAPSPAPAGERPPPPGHWPGHEADGGGSAGLPVSAGGPGADRLRRVREPAVAQDAHGVLAAVARHGTHLVQHLVLSRLVAFTYRRCIRATYSRVRRRRFRAVLSGPATDGHPGLGATLPPAGTAARAQFGALSVRPNGATLGRRGSPLVAPVSGLVGAARARRREWRGARRVAGLICSRSRCSSAASQPTPPSVRPERPKPAPSCRWVWVLPHRRRVRARPRLAGGGERRLPAQRKGDRAHETAGSAEAAHGAGRGRRWGRAASRSPPARRLRGTPEAKRGPPGRR